ncbi:hypothetical protein PPTG_10475 [Phytophthora nicotianae INRA-310]|uniref:RxLR effector protein n=1 Tax=Phytophthora nicotianae (strain INRA-310) TaxID=761204 RepID=W2QEP0_PHYN3|nr:hypothetical protein PPTG_10475 [Phytophthora nicotianae INRA-310]ETN11637.1 hypothetical protein PPTG_10475 [Phytophthora nicotianae INRA-310]
MMRLYSVRLLVATALLANVERAAPFDLTIDDYPTVVRSLADNQNVVTPKRILRRFDEADEERLVGISKMSELTTQVKDGASKLFEKVVNMKALETQAAKAMKLGPIDDTLTSSNLKYLVDQVKEMNSKSRIKKVSVIGILTTKYGDDALAKALLKAERNAESTSLFAKEIRELRAKQLKMWKSSSKSADDIFKQLRFGDDMFPISQKFEILDDYIKFIKPKAYDQTLLRTIIKGVNGNEKVGTVLYATRTDPRTVKKVNDFQQSLLRKWMGEG